MRLEHLQELGRVDGARDLGGLEELNDLLGLDDAVDRGYRMLPTRVGHVGTRPRERFKQVLYKMSSVRRRELVRRPVLAVDRRLDGQRSGRPAVSRRPSSTCACSSAGSVTARWKPAAARTDSACPRRSVVSARESTLCQVGGRRCANCAVFVRLPSCAEDGGPLGCCLRRARSASRSKPSRAALPARGRSVDSVDESATGSANLWSSIV